MNDALFTFTRESQRWLKRKALKDAKIKQELQNKEQFQFWLLDNLEVQSILRYYCMIECVL